MIISNSRKFIFVHVHKAGGSSMEQALSEHLAWNDLMLGTTELGTAMNRPFESSYGLSDHSSVRNIAAVCGPEIFEAYFSFALVRHPLDRIVSMYNFIHSLFEYRHRSTGRSHNKLRRQVLEPSGEIKQDFMAWPVTRSFAQNSDFSTFIRSDIAKSDASFTPQTEFLQTPDGKTTVDMFIRLDDLEEKLPVLWNKLGFEFSVPHANKTPFVALCVSDVSPADREFVQHVYHDDYLAFEFS